MFGTDDQDEANSDVKPIIEKMEHPNHRQKLKDKLIEGPLTNKAYFAYSLQEKSTDPDYLKAERNLYNNYYKLDQY